MLLIAMMINIFPNTKHDKRAPQNALWGALHASFTRTTPIRGASFLMLIFCANVVRAEVAVRACAGDSNWPPMSYRHQQSQEMKGISVAVLNALFPIPPVVRMRPWARCMAEVEAMQGFDILMSAFKNKEREEKFLFSRSYFSLTPSYFYSTKRFPSAPVKNLADLGKLKVCSLHGASTDYTQLPKGQIESGATNYHSLIGKIDRGYCDVVVDMKEVFVGFSKLGIVAFQDPQYQIVKLPNTTMYPLHFAVSKRHPQGEELISTINTKLLQLEKKGRLRSLTEHTDVH